MARSKMAPLLCADDIFRGDFHSKNNKKHCLIGWCRITFGMGTREYRKCIKALESEIGDQAYDIGEYNDCRSRPKSEIASLWNSVMAKLGYGGRKIKHVFNGRTMQCLRKKDDHEA